MSAGKLRNEQEPQSKHRSSVFTLTIEEGSPNDVLHFLRVSHAWLKGLEEPPSRDDFRLFLEGGFIDLVGNDAGGSYHGGLSAIDGIGNRGKSRTAENAKQECLHLIETQTVALHALLSECPELEDDPSGCAGRESDEPNAGGTEAGASRCWRNVTLDGFLNAAAEESELKEGRYERCWSWLREFYLLGQSAI